jgi:DNA-binding IclR family transcriptional regulator
MIVTPRRPQLAAALETLANEPDAEQARRTRDELIAELAHSEYLATGIDASTTIRVSHMSAPVFDRSMRAVSSILVLGPDFDMTNRELRARGEQLVQAARRATAQVGGSAPLALA